MKRRSFLKLVGISVASIAVASLPSVGSTNHKFQRFELVGDGVTNDTKAMQALFDGEEVFYNRNSLKKHGNTIHIPSGTFKIDTPILLSNSVVNKG